MFTKTIIEIIQLGITTWRKYAIPRIKIMELKPWNMEHQHYMFYVLFLLMIKIGELRRFSIYNFFFRK